MCVPLEINPFSKSFSGLIAIAPKMCINNKKMCVCVSLGGDDWVFTWTGMFFPFTYLAFIQECGATFASA